MLNGGLAGRGYGQLEWPPSGLVGGGGFGPEVYMLKRPGLWDIYEDIFIKQGDFICSLDENQRSNSFFEGLNRFLPNYKVLDS